jgi:hypothetical protein
LHRIVFILNLFAALFVLLLDILVRRVRLFDRKFLPKRRRRRA